MNKLNWITGLDYLMTRPHSSQQYVPRVGLTFPSNSLAKSREGPTPSKKIQK